MLTKRTLMKWRKEALERRDHVNTDEPLRTLQHFAERILRMTRILLDQELMKGK